ncbi:hypothetical protein D3C85_1187600 [compost metagenome]
MVSAGRAVVIVIIDQELRFTTPQFVVRRLVGRCTIFRVQPTLFAQLLEHLGALFEGHAVVVALGHDAGHVVHGAGDNCLDALVQGHGIQRHTAPTANANDANPFAINGGLQAESINCRAYVLGVDVW